MKVFLFIDEVIYCELGQNQNNINNGGFIKKEKKMLFQIRSYYFNKF